MSARCFKIICTKFLTFHVQGFHAIFIKPFAVQIKSNHRQFKIWTIST